MKSIRGLGIVGLVVLYYLARDGPVHGYEIRRTIEVETGVEIGESTLYDALRRLEKRGLARSYWAVRTGRLRRVYEATPKGAEALEEALSQARRLLAPLICGEGDRRWSRTGR